MATTERRRGLVVQAQWARMFFDSTCPDGPKLWDIRSSSPSCVKVGDTVDIVECGTGRHAVNAKGCCSTAVLTVIGHGIFDGVEEMSEEGFQANFSKHKVPLSSLSSLKARWKGSRLFAWKLTELTMLRTPIDLFYRKGAGPT
eukprot:14782803-Alexandrium_andersonii.AAC.1